MFDVKQGERLERLSRGVGEAGGFLIGREGRRDASEMREAVRNVGVVREGVARLVDEFGEAAAGMREGAYAPARKFGDEWPGDRRHLVGRIDDVLKAVSGCFPSRSAAERITAVAAGFDADLVSGEAIEEARVLCGGRDDRELASALGVASETLTGLDVLAEASERYMGIPSAREGGRGDLRVDESCPDVASCMRDVRTVLRGMRATLSNERRGEMSERDFEVMGRSLGRVASGDLAQVSKVMSGYEDLMHGELDILMSNSMPAMDVDYGEIVLKERSEALMGVTRNAAEALGDAREGRLGSVSFDDVDGTVVMLHCIVRDDFDVDAGPAAADDLCMVVEEVGEGASRALVLDADERASVVEAVESGVDADVVDVLGRVVSTSGAKARFEDLTDVTAEQLLVEDAEGNYVTSRLHGSVSEGVADDDAKARTPESGLRDGAYDAQRGHGGRDGYGS